MVKCAGALFYHTFLLEENLFASFSSDSNHIVSTCFLLHNQTKPRSTSSLKKPRRLGKPTLGKEPRWTPKIWSAPSRLSSLQEALNFNGHTLKRLMDSSNSVGRTKQWHTLPVAAAHCLSLSPSDCKLSCQFIAQTRKRKGESWFCSHRSIWLRFPVLGCLRK